MEDTETTGHAPGSLRANWLVFVAVFTVYVCLAIITFMPSLSEFAQSVITLILGMYIKELSSIYSFEFGTTRRSRQLQDAAISAPASQIIKE